MLPNAYLTNPKPKHAFVYVSTIQCMAVNLFGRQAVWSAEEEGIDEDAEQLRIPIHAFDVIVADECHRGYTTAEMSLWRNTLDHFDAIKIGLTATPAAHTKAYFRDVVFRYEYARAVRQRDFKLDSFKWLKDESLEDADELPPPEELTTDAVEELEGAVEELNAVLALLENGNGNDGSRAKRGARP